MHLHCKHALAKILALWLSVGALLSTSPALAQPDCKTLQPRRPGGGVVITQPGHYCLDDNWFVKNRFKLDIEGGRYRSDDDVLLLLAADNIVLDLQQHSVGTDSWLSAIETPEQGPENTGYHDVQPELIHLPMIDDPDYPNNPHHRFRKLPIPMNLTIRNGTVRVKYREELSLDKVGIRIAGLGGLYHDVQPVAVAEDSGMPRFSSTTVGKDLENAQKSFSEINANILIKLNKKRIQTPSAYPKRNVLIENMKVTTRGIGIVVEGANTTIRNSVIEADAGTAIWIYGPNAVIENNTIIVHGTRKLLEADAPIRLQQADGAIIRNNRIIIKDKAHKRGISTFDTGAFTLQNNTFYGITSKDALARSFIGKLQMNAKNNTYEPIEKAEPSWKAWFNWLQ